MEYSEVTFRSDMTIELIDSMGDDRSILRAMMVSTRKDRDVDAYGEDDVFGKLNFLMKNRHGTPFEHATMTFRAEVPIFVMREWHRHRIGVSYNEMSGRYTQLPPTYYIPGPDRNLVQVGKPGHYTFVPGDPETYEWLRDDMEMEAVHNYRRYEDRLAKGIAKEVARMSLGINIYTAQYFTCNPRSLMAYLSLRTKAEPFWQEWSAPDEFRSSPQQIERVFSQNPGGSMFPSFPMREIEMASEMMEDQFAAFFPHTHASFCENGRVCP